MENLTFELRPEEAHINKKGQFQNSNMPYDMGLTDHKK